jgi:hypothetical protein
MAAPRASPESEREGEALRLVKVALDLPDGERNAFLVAGAAGDPGLLEAARQLLKACRLAERDGAFMSGPAGAFAEPMLLEVERGERSLGEASLPIVRDALRGRYEFVREIGRGGSATVHLARDLKHGRDVAIKVVKHGVADRGQRARFLSEIAIAAQLQHPHILPLIDSGDANGALYYVMPYVEGESLRQRLDREGALPLEDALAITRDVAEALDYAHAAGIVHRDIKPQNILLGNGHALMADFGIALALETTLQDRVTEDGVAVGTPTYMSPEQATASAQVDARTDVYSLACVVYEMLAGEAPYPGVTPRSVIAKHVNAPVPDLGVLRPTLPGGITRALTIALAKSPSDRYRSAGAFCAAISQTSGELAGHVRRRPFGRRALVAAAAGVVALVVASWPATVTWRERRAPAPVDTTVYAVYPVISRDGAEPPRDLTPLVHDAVSAWTGLRVVDPSVVQGYFASRPGPWSVQHASDFARSAGAGRFVWGESAPVGDSIRVHLRVSDVAGRGLVLNDRVLYLPAVASAADSAFARAADALLLRSSIAGARLNPKASRSLPAQQAYHLAWRWLGSWELDSAVRYLERAVGHDAQFGQAHLWLAIVRAWSGADSARYQVAAEQANLHATTLSPRERDLARAILMESRGDVGAACPVWRRLTRSDSADFAGWFGSARCLARDSLVHRDRRSPTGWSFRSSTQRMIRDYEEAFRRNPAILSSLRRRSFEPLRGLLLANAGSYRSGRTAPPESRRFVGRPELHGDSIAVVALPGTGALSVPQSRAQIAALHRQREVMRDITSNWVAAHPQSADARQALAIALAALGDPSARDTLASARVFVSSEAERLGLGLTEVWMELSFGIAGPDIARLRRARQIADSILRTVDPERTIEPRQVAALAALTGRVQLAGRLVRRSEVGRAMEAPPSLLSTAPALLTYAALREPSDSVRWLLTRVETEIDRTLQGDAAANARRAWLARSATLCYPDCPVEPYAAGRQEDYLLDIQLRHRANLLDEVEELLRDLRETRTHEAPEAITYDGLAPEAELLLSLGHYQRAIDWLSPSMERATQQSLARLADPVATACVVRAMIVRAMAAEKLGNRREAERWRAAVWELRSGADRPLP